MIRRAIADDAYTLARLQGALWDEMHPEQPFTAAVREASFVYWYEALEREQIVGWLAEAGATPVGMAALLISHHPPRPTGTLRRGFVTSVYVAPEQRRQGHGRALMAALIDYAAAQGLQRLELRTSHAGRALYDALGFSAEEMLMLRLDQG